MNFDGSQSFAFIPLDGHGKPKAKHRKLIRSHAMSGRNLRIGVNPVSDDHDGDSGQYGKPSWQPTQSAQDGLVLGDNSKAGGHLYARDQDEARGCQLLPTPPDLALCTYAGEVDADSRMLIFNFYTKGNETLGPVESCVDFGPARRLWLSWLMQDTSYTHPVLFGIAVIDCVLSQKPLGKKALYHLGKTHIFLNQRLADRSVSLQDSTIFVVISMIVYLSATRDFRTAMVHMKGLGEMIRLRGGLDSFRYSPRLYTKLGRLDLAYCLYSGEKSVFPTENTSRPDLGSYEDLSPPQAVADVKNQELLAIFQDLQHISNTVNTESASRRRTSAIAFQTVICSVQDRLLRLQGTLDDNTAECLRLAMLAFIASTVQVSGPEIRYPYLAGCLRERCNAIEKSTSSMRVLMLWFLMVGAISLFGTAEAWLLERWRSEVSSQMTWEEARRRLKDIMWIDAIHDQPGRQAFENLSLREVGGIDRSSPIAKLWATGWAGNTYEL